MGGMGFFHGEVATFLGSNAGLGLGPSPGRGRQRCSCRPLHVSVAPHSPCSCATSAARRGGSAGTRSTVGLQECSSGDVTARSGRRDTLTEGQSSSCGTVGQCAHLLLRARGSELHPRARKRSQASKYLQIVALGCSRNISHPFLGPK